MPLSNLPTLVGSGLVAPLITKYIARHLPSLNALEKLTIGLVLIASGYFLLFVAKHLLKDTNGQISAIWIILTYGLFGIGDVFVWPAQIAAAAALAPKHLTSL